MIRPASVLLSALIFVQGHAFAKAPADPCHTKSRQMTMVKNCYTGDMKKPGDGSGLFFAASEINAEGRAYCYNSLIMVEHNQIHVMKDGKDGQFQAYNYSLPPTELKKIKKDTPLFTLKGLKGKCFSPKGEKEICDGGILKAIGWKDTDQPMVVAIGKAPNGQLAISQLVYDAKTIETGAPKEIEPTQERDVTKLTPKLLAEIRRKIVTAARGKMSIMHSPGMTPLKLGQASEQFRYCTMALEGFLKSQKLPDPLSPEEKMTLATLTNYMNNEPVPATTGPAGTRMPASRAASRK